MALDPRMRIALSCLVGFGLALMFRKVCKGNNCVVVQGPNPLEVQRNVYKIEGDCFRYTPYVVPCEGDAGARPGARRGGAEVEVEAEVEAEAES